MDERRARRVSEVLREEIAEIVGFELQDPRLGAVEVTAVLLGGGGKMARVKVAVNGGDREKKNALDALEHAGNYVREEVARRLDLRRIPELRFEVDRFAGVENRIDFLLRRVKKNRARD